MSCKDQIKAWEVLQFCPENRILAATADQKAATRIGPKLG
jgi:hypothetical protein